MNLLEPLLAFVTGVDGGTMSAAISSDITVAETLPVKRPVGRPRKRPRHVENGKLVVILVYTGSTLLLSFTHMFWHSSLLFFLFYLKQTRVQTRVTHSQPTQLPLSFAEGQEENQRTGWGSHF